MSWVDESVLQLKRKCVSNLQVVCGKIFSVPIRTFCRIISLGCGGPGFVVRLIHPDPNNLECHQGQVKICFVQKDFNMTSGREGVKL